MPGPIVGEWKDPSKAQTSCSCVPTIRHSTVAPTGTDTLAGMNQWSPISTRNTGAPAALVTTALGVGAAALARCAIDVGAPGAATPGRDDVQPASTPDAARTRMSTSAPGRDK